MKAVVTFLYSMAFVVFLTLFFERESFSAILHLMTFTISTSFIIASSISCISLLIGTLLLSP